MPDSGTQRSFARELRPFQLRLRMSALVRYALATSIAALVIVDAAIVVLRPGALAAAMTCGGAIVLAAVVAYAVAVFRTPQPIDTARAVDQFFRLDDRAVTALQFSGAPDPISRLIVDDATRRLAGVSVATLPIGSHSILKWAGVATAAASVLVIILVARDPSASYAAATGTGNSTAGAGQGRAAGPGARQGGPADGSANTTLSASSAAPPPAATEGQKAGASGASGSRMDGPDTPVDERTGTVAEGASTAERPTPSEPSTGGERSSPTTSATAARAGGGDREGRGSGSATSGAGRGGRSIGPVAAASGGVANGALRGDGVTASQPERAPPSTNQTTAARAGNVGAEAVVGDEHVPPRLRAYVRDYFVAVRNRADR